MSSNQDEKKLKKYHSTQIPALSLGSLVEEPIPILTVPKGKSITRVCSHKLSTIYKKQQPDLMLRDPVKGGADAWVERC